MNRTSVYKTPQFIAALIGGWLVLAGTLSLIAQPSSDAPLRPSTSGDTTLQVVPGTQQPGETSTHLQGATGLQGQTQGGLQRPDVAEQLQPNAKTDRLTETDAVQ